MWLNTFPIIHQLAGRVTLSEGKLTALVKVRRCKDEGRALWGPLKHLLWAQHVGGEMWAWSFYKCNYLGEGGDYSLLLPRENFLSSMEESDELTMTDTWAELSQRLPNPLLDFTSISSLLWQPDSRLIGGVLAAVPWRRTVTVRRGGACMGTTSPSFLCCGCTDEWQHARSLAASLPLYSPSDHAYLTR